MRYMLVIIIALLLLPNESLGFTVRVAKDVATPTASVGPRVVYGTVQFTVTRQTTSDLAKLLWQDITAQSFGTQVKKGKYIVTLEIKNIADESVVGRQILASYTIDSIVSKTPILGGLFGYKNVTEQTTQDGETQWTGQLFKTPILLDTDNNIFRVDLVTYYSDNSEFTPQFFSAAANLINDVRSLTILGNPATAGFSASVTQLANLLDAQLFGKQKRGLVISGKDAVSMSFIKLNQNPARPNKITYELLRQGTTKPQMSITVEFNTIAARAANFSIGLGQFTGLNTLTAIDVLNIKLGEKSIVDSLKTTSNPAVRQFIADWLGGNGYKGNDIAARCSDLRVELGKYFSSRDSSAIYWALVESYADSLKKSHVDHTTCVEPIRADMEKIGLKFSNFTKKD